MTKITEKQLNNYIKHLFGKKYKIKVTHHFYKYKGAGAVACRKTNTITIRQDQLKLKEFPHDLLWHEMGHLKTSDGKGFSVKNETNAQLWAMKELKKRGYSNIYKQSLKYVKDWNNLTLDMKKNMQIIYATARNKILKKEKHI